MTVGPNTDLWLEVSIVKLADGRMKVRADLMLRGCGGVAMHPKADGDRVQILRTAGVIVRSPALAAHEAARVEKAGRLLGLEVLNRGTARVQVEIHGSTAAFEEQIGRLAAAAQRFRGGRGAEMTE